MANDNNFNGNIDLLDANPWLGRGRVAGTGLPLNEAVLFGYDSTTILAVDAPLGSIALLTDGKFATKVAAGATSWSIAAAVADQVVNDGDAIAVDKSYSFGITMGAGVETNTLAAPTFLGQTMTMTVDVDGGGTRAVTVAAAFDKASNTVITFGAGRDSVGLVCVRAGALRWQLAYNDGAVLS